MKSRWLIAVLFVLAPIAVQAQETKKGGDKKKVEKFDAKPALVPYRLTDTHHTLVRVKINGKGPFNFVVDTGCPVFLISEPVGKKIGLDKGWVNLDSLELEGGLEIKNLKARVETPFQIEGMNSMGLAGVELHGLMGYTVLAKYKMDFDYTKMQMSWTPVKTEPLAPVALGGKSGGGGMEIMVGAMSLIFQLLGAGPPPPPQPRGFFGFEMEQKDKTVLVARVLADSPADKAGLKQGDRIVQVQSSGGIEGVGVVLERARKLTPGKTLDVTVERGTERIEIKITAGSGL